jgi:hypothetical protein
MAMAISTGQKVPCLNYDDTPPLLNRLQVKPNLSKGTKLRMVNSKILELLKGAKK